jgi:hypothetical protein
MDIARRGGENNPHVLPPHPPTSGEITIEKRRRKYTEYYHPKLKTLKYFILLSLIL